MDMLTLQASARDLGVKAKKVRNAGRVPAVVYGSVDGNLHVEIEAAALHKTFNKAGASTLVELDVAGKKVPVLFKEVTFHPITDRETHADFYAVDMKKEIEAPVPLIFEGESPAVKELSAILVTAHDTVRVRCLPADLPHSLSISIASLATLNDVLTVKELKLPKGVKVMEAPETVLMSVQEQRAEEVVATPTPEEVAAAAAAAAPAGGGPIPGQTEGPDKPAEAAQKEGKEKAAKK
jgi:large subunit ribosomal protein L25